MTHTFQFIEDAVKGNWKYQGYSPVWDDLYGTWFVPDDNSFENVVVAEVLIDPNAWRAVGKVRGWTYDHKEPGSPFGNMTLGEWKRHHWKSHWHRFIDLLADGLSPEDALGRVM